MTQSSKFAHFIVPAESRLTENCSVALRRCFGLSQMHCQSLYQRFHWKRQVEERTSAEDCRRKATTTSSRMNLLPVHPDGNKVALIDGETQLPPRAPHNVKLHTGWLRKVLMTEFGKTSIARQLPKYYSCFERLNAIMPCAKSLLPVWNQLGRIKNSVSDDLLKGNPVASGSWLTSKPT